jgi:hypothetical protein
MDKHFTMALNNITKYGDTDIFPFPIENHIFFDKQADVVTLLGVIERDFDNFILQYPPIHEQSLAAIGYNGFRWATQIDPIWNAYLLALVISIGEDIERARVSTDKQVVFSYRFKPDTDKKTLFAQDLGWISFQRISGDLAGTHSHVLVCDISDFYQRIYHHRLENALKKATSNAEAVRKIISLLSRISKGASYGLPVGGPAARLLSELLLNRMDRLLLAEGITFCRYADDYHIFTNSREQAYEHLVFITERLLENEGLSLQKAKTRILSSQEFLSTSGFSEHDTGEDAQTSQTKSFLSLKLHFDPYSPTADEDYEALKDELRKFDIVGMLATELQKSQLHQGLTKRLIRSVEYLDQDVRGDVVLMLLDSIVVLYPIFPSVMMLIKGVISYLDTNTKERVFEVLRMLINTGSYITRVPVNLAFAIRVLALDLSDETDEVFGRLYRETSSMMLRRDIILAMAKRNGDYWISDRRKHFYNLNSWERRALLIASFILEDEGSHWRKKIKRELSPMELLAIEWANEKKNSGGWEVPL